MRNWICHAALGLAAATVQGNAAASQATWFMDQNNAPVFEAAKPRPAGATRQWMSFWFQSNGLFGTGRHVAVALRGNIGRDANGQALTSAVTGRGITIGHTSGVEPETDLFGFSQIAYFPERRHGGCLNWWLGSAGTRPGQTQVEIFLPSSNRLYQSSCGPELPIIFSQSFGYIPDASRGLQDNVWYRYTIEVSDAGSVRYRIEDTGGNTLADQTVEDGWESAFVVDGATQWIGVSDGSGLPQSVCLDPYCDQPVYEPYWSVQFAQIEGGWY